MQNFIGQEIGQYKIIQEVAHGAMGAIYLSKHLLLEREVAIKILPPGLASNQAFIARFLREARLIAQLNHPGIVQIYDAGKISSTLYYVMEYVQGKDMAQMIHDEGPVSLDMAIQVGLQVADALEYAYAEAGVVHRDIKPANLIIEKRRGRVKVLDFGLTKANNSAPLTVAGMILGSLLYRSPEQLLGHAIDNRTDIYSLGVVLYEMITGVQPFKANTINEVSRLILQERVAPPSDSNAAVTREVDRIILKMIQRNPELRYHSSAELALALGNLPHTSGTAVPWKAVPEVGTLSTAPVLPRSNQQSSVEVPDFLLNSATSEPLVPLAPPPPETETKSLAEHPQLTGDSPPPRGPGLFKRIFKKKNN